MDMNELEVSGYKFRALPDKGIEVTFSTGEVISLAGLKIELVGLRIEHPSTWTVSLLTDLAVKKVKHGIEDSLKLISFDFDSLHEALAVQAFIIYTLSNESGV